MAPPGQHWTASPARRIHRGIAAGASSALAEALQGHARDWAVRAIAESLIRQAQSKFEKERQPDVIRHAERFFLDVTDGAYEAVYSPLGSSEINVRDAAGNIRVASAAQPWHP